MSAKPRPVSLLPRASVGEGGRRPDEGRRATRGGTEATPGLIVAAPASGSGKTVVTLALLRALADAGVAVASAKAGPDYIDPRFHAIASGRPCPNLDVWAMRPDTIAHIVAEPADLLLIEGVMGLFDGPQGASGSTADLAAALGLPVILILDVSRQGQSVAALARGFSDFRPEVDIAGVILNRVGSTRHRDLLLSALKDAGIRVFGAVPRSPALALPERHLGLVQAAEHPDLEAFLAAAGALIAGAVDLAALRATARPIARAMPDAAAHLPPLGQRIALADDKAFGFAYPHLLSGWRAEGAEILPFSPLADEPPWADADAIFLPGGYPELHAGRIAANSRFLDGLRDAAGRGVLVYGECGGYMVLGDSLVDASGHHHLLAGLLPVSTSFASPKLSLGYREMRHGGLLPFPPMLRGHEFHYSTLMSQGAAEPLFEVRDAAGTGLGTAGLRLGRVMGSYLHVIDGAEE